MANNSRDWNKVNLESLQGQQWNAFNASFDELTAKNDIIDDVYPFKSTTNGVNCKSNKSDTMKLKREDMYLYGQCPAWDHFYLVVCEYCGKVIKPQAMSKHIEMRHVSSKRANASSTKSNAPVTTNSSSSAPNCVQNSRVSNSNLTNNSVVNFTSAKVDSSESVVVNNAKLTSSLSSSHSVVPITSISASMAPIVDETALNDHHQQQHQQQQRVKKEPPSTPSKNASKKLNRGKMLPCKDREYDPNKHCGVKASENDKPCTRSLTCKTHSLTLRRSVPGRNKQFDDLLSEHRAAKEAALIAAGLEVKPTKQQLKQKEQEARRLQQQQQQQLQQQSQQQQQQHQLQQQQQQKCVSLLRKQHCVQQTVCDQSSSHHRLTRFSVQNHRDASSECRVIEKDGCLYLPRHPKPQALCTFNTRHQPFSKVNMKRLMEFHVP